ncbi:hypothetical protein AAC387_Pa02g2459 [Persea americana]
MAHVNANIDIDGSICKVNALLDSAQPMDVGQWKQKVEHVFTSTSESMVEEESVIVEPPKLELKPSPENLKYAYLGSSASNPVIIASDLEEEKEKKLPDVLKDHQSALGTKGIVDYTNCDDMKYVIRKLDDFNFRNAFSRPYIRATFGQELKVVLLRANIFSLHIRRDHLFPNTTRRRNFLLPFRNSIFTITNSPISTVTLLFFFFFNTTTVTTWYTSNQATIIFAELSCRGSPPIETRTSIFHEHGPVFRYCSFSFTIFVL